jgi:uncharacterized membrane protein YdbT with pleckstrin-like domain
MPQKSYLQEVIRGDEQLIHMGQLHWLFAFRAFMSIVWGLFFSALILAAAVFLSKQFKMINPALPPIESLRALHIGIRAGALVIFGLGVLKFIHMMAFKVTTEMAVTDQRVILKWGILNRVIQEMRIGSIEGVNVLQGITGRMLNYGRIVVQGMGQGEIIMPSMADPVKFRRAIDKAREIYENKD